MCIICLSYAALSLQWNDWRWNNQQRVANTGLNALFSCFSYYVTSKSGSCLRFFYSNVCAAVAITSYESTVSRRCWHLSELLSACVEQLICVPSENAAEPFQGTSNGTISWEHCCAVVTLMVLLLHSGTQPVQHITAIQADANEKLFRLHYGCAGGRCYNKMFTAFILPATLMQGDHPRRCV